MDAAETADAEHRKQQAEAERARAALAEAAARSRLPTSNFAGWICSSVRSKPVQPMRAMTAAQADVDKEAALRARLEVATRERDESSAAGPPSPSRRSMP